MSTCVINFSGRKNGNCHDIAKVIEKSMSEHSKTVLFEICDLSITPCGKCSYECFRSNTSCPYSDDDIAKVYTALCSCECIYYVVPNYINYPNAYFFIFSERKQGFFSYKPDLLKQYLDIEKKFIVVSNTEGENFKQVFKHHLLETVDPNILFLSAKDFDKGSVLGGMLESEQAKQMVVDFISRANGYS